MLTQKQNSTCSGVYLYSGDIRHRNLHHLSTTMNRLTHRKEKKQRERGLGKKVGDWTGRVEISKKKTMAIVVACMAIF